MGVKAKNMNLTEGTIWKQIVLFAFPLMCSNLFQQLYNTADTMVVGAANALPAGIKIFLLGDF